MPECCYLGSRKFATLWIPDNSLGDDFDEKFRPYSVLSFGYKSAGKKVPSSACPVRYFSVLGWALSPVYFLVIWSAGCDEVYDAKYIKRKAVQGARYENISLYEAPYEPEYLQFYVLPGTDKFSRKGVEFNQEMRRVGYGYEIDRKKLLLEE